METYSFMFGTKNEIFKFIFTENRTYRQMATGLKSRVQKTEMKNLLFFNEIVVEYKASKLP